MQRAIARSCMSMTRSCMLSVAVSVLLCCSWSYDIASNVSTWINGGASIAPAAMYPSVQGLSSGQVIANGPGASSGFAFVDPSGSLWYGYGSSGFGFCNGRKCLKHLPFEFCPASEDILAHVLVLGHAFWFSDLWYMPSPAGVVSLDLFPAAYSSFTSPLGAIARSGSMRISLGVQGGFLQYLNFSLVAQDRFTQTGLVMIKVIQAAPRTSTSWGAMLSWLNGVPVNLDVTAFVQGLFVQTVPPALASGVANLAIALTGNDGSTLSPPDTLITLLLGARGSSSSYVFTVFAEDYMISSTFNVTVLVPLLTDNRWSMGVSGAGIQPLSLNSSMAPGITTLRFPYVVPTPIALDSSTLSVWMGGDDCASDGLFSEGSGDFRVALDGNAPSSREGALAWTGIDGQLYFFGTYVWNGNGRER
jgi:hypothetical protein